MRETISFLLIVFISSCSNMHKVEIQGHRGCRGIYPENTIPGFVHALDLGVDVIELDVVISKDSMVVVSHEPYFNHVLIDSIDGQRLDSTNDIQFNIYKLNYEQIKNYDVGSKPHPRFPNQKKMKVNKPLLSESIIACDNHAKSKGKTLPYYNIEIKRNIKYDTLYHPEGHAFADLVMNVIKKLNVGNDRYNIQSFDPEILNLIQKKYPTTVQALLVENDNGLEANLSKLNFKPRIYSPYFKLVNAELIAKCQSRGIKVIPWTVNEVEDAKKLIEMQVDGIITDYPDKINASLNNK